MSSRQHLLVLCVLVLLLRIPFWNQAIGGDDPYYLAAAEHALIDPLHPNHTWYVFEGRDVNFQGYPHPPLNAWVLAALLALTGDIHEIFFHAAYTLYSLAAVCAMYALARRFSRRPFWAAVLFLAVPAFVVNGNTLESDIPLLAFWMCGAAAFIRGVDRQHRGLLALSAGSLTLAALTSMQSVLFTPILLAYLLLLKERRTPGRAAIAFTPVLTLIAWQVFERIASGVFPAAVSAGYQAAYGYFAVLLKARSALALLIHALFMVLPLLLPWMFRGVRGDRDRQFLWVWTGLFLAGAMVLFFAGAARYLLPMAAPLCLLAASAPLNWVRFAGFAQLAISAGLATVNYQLWDAYRGFAASLRSETSSKRVWVDAEWGLRYYLEADGARPIHRDQWIPTGDLVVESELGFPAPFRYGGRTLVTVRQMEIRPRLPFRLLGLEARSGYATAALGLLPYDVRGGLIDRVRALRLDRFAPTRTNLPMGEPGIDNQILSGIYASEGQPWRWMSGEGSVLLKNPGRPATLQARVYIADNAPARRITLGVEGGPSTTASFSSPGPYTLKLAVPAPGRGDLTVKLTADRIFHVPGDSRELGIIVNEIGFAP